MNHSRIDLSEEKSEGDINLSKHRKNWQSAVLDEKTKNLLAEDSKYFLHQSLSTPCLNGLEECHGINLTDLQGREIMDFHGNSVHQVGFGHPEVINAIKNQLDVLPFCTRRYTNQVAVDFARKLVKVAPGDLNRVLLTPGGTSAIGMALKLARLITGRHKTISMWDSFHGASLDAISIGGESIFRNGVGPLLPGTEHVPPPDENHCLWDCKDRGGCDLKCANYIEYILEKEGDVAAVIAEPIRSTPYVPPPDYWKTVKKACERHGAMLILDEIYQGLGRTGKMFACEHFDVVPDILVLGKGLGGGVFPLAAIVTKEEYNVLGDRALGHYTHEKNPVACAAGLATLNIIEKENLVENARELGEYTKKQLLELKKKHSIISDVRGVGLILGIELANNGERATDEAEQVMYQALSKGLSFKITMGNILLLSPPLTVSKEEMDLAIKILDESISEVTNKNCT